MMPRVFPSGEITLVRICVILPFFLFTISLILSVMILTDVVSVPRLPVTGSSLPSKLVV